MIIKKNASTSYVLSVKEHFHKNQHFISTHRIAATYERFLDNTNDIREIALRNRFASKGNEQQNSENEVISDNDSNIADDSVQTPALPSSSFEARRSVCPEKLNSHHSITNNVVPPTISTSQSEVSAAKESVIVQNTAQQVQSTTDDTLDTSLFQHSNDTTPATVAQANYQSLNDETLADLDDYIICQAANNGNSLGQNVQNDTDWDQLQKMLDIVAAQAPTVDNALTNAEQIKAKLEQGTLTNQSTINYI